MRLGILTTDYVRAELAEQYGEYPDMFSRLLLQAEPSLEICSYDVKGGVYPKDIDEVDAYLITGSSHSVYDDLDWIRDLGVFVKTLHKTQKKLIGICFGHQLIAHFLGGRTEVSPKGWGIGVHSYSLTERGKDFTGQKTDFKLIASHRDQVIVPAEGSTILAGNAFCPIAMYTVGNSIFSVQGHPEFEEAYFEELLALRKGLFEEKHYENAKTSISGGNDALLIAKWIIDFIK